MIANVSFHNCEKEEKLLLIYTMIPLHKILSFLIDSLRMKKIFLLFLLSLTFYSFSQPAFSPLVWQHKFPDSRGMVIKKDFDGNLLAAGRSLWGGTIITKHDSSGNLLWEEISNDQYYLLHDMDIDSDGSVYFTGYIYDTTLSITGNPFLIKYNSLGVRQWVRVIESGKAYKIKVFNNKHIYIAGIRDSTFIIPGAIRAFAACFDSSGNRSWYHLDSSNYETNGSILEIDKFGNAYMGGPATCCLPGYDFFVTKLDSNGIKKWSFNYPDPNINYFEPDVSTIDDSANIYISGGAVVSGGVPYDCLIAKLDSSGNLKWWNYYSRNFGTNEWEFTTDLLGDKYGNLYVTGFIEDFTFLPMRQDGFIAKFTSTGQLSWAYIYNGSNNASADFLGCISSINDSIIIGAGSGIYSATGGGLVILALDTSGQLLTKLETNGVFSAIDVVKSTSSFYFTGTRIDNSSIGTAYDSMMVFRVDYFENTLSMHEFLTRQELKVYPNPFSQKIKIEVSHQSHIKSVKLFNSIGRLVHSDIVNDSSLQLNCAFLPSGLYLLEVTDSEGNVKRKKLLKTD